MKNISEGKNPLVSVIVIVRNAQKTITDCLDSLMRLDYPKDQREIILVDNGSTDQTKDIVDTYNVRYLYESKRGRGYARNKGVKEARGRYIAFTDADCIVDTNWLKNILRGFEGKDHIAICGGKIVGYKTETDFEAFAEEIGFLDQESGIFGKDLLDLPRVVTANAAFRKSAIEEAGYFDEDLITSEDTEISWRISFLGYEMTYVSDSIVYHQHKARFLEFCAHHFEYGQAAAVISFKYGVLHLGIGGGTGLRDALRLCLKPLKNLCESLISRLSGNSSKENKSSFYWALLQTCTFCGSISVMAKARLGLTKHSLKEAKDIKPFCRSMDFLDGQNRRWSLQCLATWFQNAGSLCLVVFSEGSLTYRLNDTASRIWLSLQRTKETSRTIEEIADYYQRPIEEIKQDVRNFVSFLEKEEILRRTS